MSCLKVRWCRETIAFWVYIELLLCTCGYNHIKKISVGCMENAILMSHSSLTEPVANEFDSCLVMYSKVVAGDVD